MRLGCDPAGTRRLVHPCPGERGAGSCGGPGLEFISHWEEKARVLTFGGRRAAHCPRDQAQHPWTSARSQTGLERGSAAWSRGGVKVETTQLQPGSQGAWLLAPALPAGPGDLGLVPAHLLTSFPIYERRWVKLGAPPMGSLPSLTFSGPVSMAGEARSAWGQGSGLRDEPREDLQHQQDLHLEETLGN